MPGFWNNLFNRMKQPRKTQRVEVMSGGPAVFTPFSGNAYESDIYRAAVDAIARNAAKLQGTHIVSAQSGQRKDGDNSLNYLLQTRPNPYMTAYDMTYKLVTHYYLYNNAFAWLQKDERGNLLAIWPVRPQSMDYVTDQAGVLYASFLLSGGKKLTVPFSEVFAIRRFFNDNDLLGDMNTAILPTLNLAHTQSEGMENAIKSSAEIRGLIKYNQTLSDSKLKEARDRFVADYMNVSNNGGIAALDVKFDYVPLENKPVTIDDKQLQSIKNKIYGYLGISEGIVNSTYTEDEYGAFYESVIEPLALQFSLEFTDKLFTQREQRFGNKIIFEANRMMFSSNASKTAMLKDLMPLGLFTTNQALEVLNLPPVQDGDKRLQTLNVVDAQKANQYQVNETQPLKGAIQTGGGSNEGTTNSGTQGE